LVATLLTTVALLLLSGFRHASILAAFAIAAAGRIGPTGAA